jgi:cell division protein FtsN
LYLPKHRIPLLTATLALLLTGCVVPVAVSIASYSFSGLSLIATGKGTGDLALSQATEQNCATWRILKGDDICRDYTPEERHEMRLARAEANNYTPGWHPSNEPDYSAMVPLRSHAELVAEVDRAEAAERALASAGASERQAKQGATPPAAVLASAESAQVQRRAAAVTVEPLKPTAQRQANAPAPLPPAAKPTAPRKALTALASALPIPAPKPLAAAQPAPAVKDARADNAYLVLGSYSTRANAESGLAHYAVVRPMLSIAKVDGKEVFRVVSGPFGMQDLAKVRATLAKSYDIRKSWTIPSCGNADAQGCALAKRADPQIASLQHRI